MTFNDYSWYGYIFFIVFFDGFGILAREEYPSVSGLLPTVPLEDCSTPVIPSCS